MDSPDRVAADLARNLSSLRRARALTQDALARVAAVPRSTIANLESGIGNPSLIVLVKVANALAVPIDELTAPARAKVRRWNADDVATESRGRGVTMRALAPEPLAKELLTLMDFAPGASMRGSPHLPGTREFFTCLLGRVTIHVVGERHELDAGDVLGFPGNVAHAYQNPDPERPARGVSVVLLAKAGV